MPVSGFWYLVGYLASCFDSERVCQRWLCPDVLWCCLWGALVVLLQLCGGVSKRDGFLSC